MITDDKIIMTNLEGEGHIETYLKLNPEVKVGDILVRNDMGVENENRRKKNNFKKLEAR